MWQLACRSLDSTWIWFKFKNNPKNQEKACAWLILKKSHQRVFFTDENSNQNFGWSKYIFVCESWGAKIQTSPRHLFCRLVRSTLCHYTWAWWSTPGHPPGLSLQMDSSTWRRRFQRFIIHASGKFHFPPSPSRTAWTMAPWSSLSTKDKKYCTLLARIGSWQVSRSTRPLYMWVSLSWFVRFHGLCVENAGFCRVAWYAFLHGCLLWWYGEYGHTVVALYHDAPLWLTPLFWGNRYHYAWRGHKLVNSGP